jgi:hypothetical protein
LPNGKILICQIYRARNRDPRRINTTRRRRKRRRKTARRIRRRRVRIRERRSATLTISAASKYAGEESRNVLVLYLVLDEGFK